MHSQVENTSKRGTQKPKIANTLFGYNLRHKENSRKHPKWNKMPKTTNTWFGHNL